MTSVCPKLLPVFSTVWPVPFVLSSLILRLTLSLQSTLVTVNAPFQVKTFTITCIHYNKGHVKYTCTTLCCVHILREG